MIRANKRRRLLAGEPPLRHGENTPEGRMAGRLAVTTNGVRFFLPVLPGIERPEDWQAFHEGVRASLSPIGTYEDDLTRRLAHVLWRWHRLERHEVAVTMDYIKEHVLGWDERQALDTVLEQTREEIEREDRRAHKFLARLQTLTAGASEVRFSADEAQQILSGFAETLQNQMDDDEDDDEEASAADSQNGDAPVVIEKRDYSAAELLAEIQVAADAAQLDWRAVLGGYVTERIKSQAHWQAGLEAARAHIELHLIPDQTNLERLCSYERHLSGEVRKLRSLLEREQALRKGQPVAPPLAVDVQLSAAPQSTPNDLH
jgi:signal transduction histidine kinase